MVCSIILIFVVLVYKVLAYIHLRMEIFMKEISRTGPNMGGRFVCVYFGSLV